ncbi:Glycosyltransferase involved in cell wall bisynthesis [Catalinimonas alkaloidigena]|uniref:Glycosyltransferase involved in cell wall bisynthesis n=1 Tax=Catalinimonas alkaloidigena TaxID=1075417 RepID=A0A1G9QK03_9BACT|nr:glycosyltransferase family 4 protein [Catalinimonas alkaloidigena]SDM11349.1 Glycosyltransferase involved in cell wall bisynthesis [Catalinimonas alkaloidigena]
MKILMSAYACEPNWGSEPEVGWRWMKRLAAQATELVVVTRSEDRYKDANGKTGVRNSRANIEKAMETENLPNVRFLYYDLPDQIANTEQSFIGANVCGYLWELAVFPFLLQHFGYKEFDLVQRVTIVAYRFPTSISYFGKRFIYGPLAGGERAPLRLMPMFSFKNQLKEWTRRLIQYSALVDPLVLLTLQQADEVIAVTHDTYSILPAFARKKAIIEPATSIDEKDFRIDETYRGTRDRQDPTLRLLFVGRLLEWKGVLLTLKALHFLGDALDYEMTIVGDGPDAARFRAYAAQHNLRVHFTGHISRTELSQYYFSHDLFVLPSLHDSGGFVVLEAHLHDLPVLVLALGGPREIASPEKGDIMIDPQGLTPDQLAAAIANQLLAFQRKRLGPSA